MKKLLLAAVFAVVLPASPSFAAVTDGSDMGLGVAGSAARADDMRRSNWVMLRKGQMLNIRGGTIFWVLGGGLVAVSLVARRVSS